jgi:hypothetical protein
MALANRAYVWESQVVSLTDTNGASTDQVANLIKIFRNLEIRITTDTMEADVAHDPADDENIWRHPRPRSREWNVSITAVVTDNASSSGATEQLFEFAGIGLGSSSNDGQMDFAYLGPVPVSPGTGAGIFSVSGLMTVESVELNYPGEEAEQVINLVGYGTPTVELRTS